ncbi:hypothetical protein [Streptomyces swartbergensis]|uniref:hypothetical protein n=1 Tax=Streptomyces swartbergensis TaxID=487165 RepID=UPI003826F769
MYWRGKDTDGQVGSRQQSAQLPVFHCQLVDRPHRPFDIGTELFELRFVLLSEFLEPYDLFAEPGLGIRGLSALFDLGMELVLQVEVAPASMARATMVRAPLERSGRPVRAVHGNADAVALVCCSAHGVGPFRVIRVRS